MKACRVTMQFHEYPSTWHRHTGAYSLHDLLLGSSLLSRKLFKSNNFWWNSASSSMDNSYRTFGDELHQTLFVGLFSGKSVLDSWAVSRTRKVVQIMNPKALDFNLARQNLFTLDSCLAANVLANHSLIIAKYDFPLRNQASRTTKSVEAYHKVLYQVIRPKVSFSTSLRQVLQLAGNDERDIKQFYTHAGLRPIYERCKRQRVSKKRSALALMVIIRTVFTFHTGCSYSYRETNYMQLTILQSELDSIAKLYDDGSVFLAAMGPTSVAKGKRAKILYSNERRIVDGRRS